MKPELIYRRVGTTYSAPTHPKSDKSEFCTLHMGHRESFRPQHMAMQKLSPTTSNSRAHHQQGPWKGKEESPVRRFLKI